MKIEIIQFPGAKLPFHRKPFERIWQEDDATASLEGHEGLEQAWARLFGKPLAEEPRLEVFDDSDCEFVLHPGGFIALHSYPGNAEIRRVKLPEET